MSNTSAGYRRCLGRRLGQRLGQLNPLIVRQRGDPQCADPPGPVLSLLPVPNIGQDRVETRRTALMRLTVTLDQLLTVGDLDGQGVVLPHNALDELQPAFDSRVFLRVPQSLSAPPAQSGEPVELQKPADAGSRDLPP